MKIFHMLILCLCSLSVYSQSAHQSGNATYVLEKATFTICKYGTTNPLEVREIDPKQMDRSEIYYTNVLLEANTYNGTLHICLLTDNYDYKVELDRKLIRIDKRYNPDEPFEESIPDPFEDIPRELQPYTTTFDNNRVTYTVHYYFGGMGYDFPLEGFLNVTLIKQN